LLNLTGIIAFVRERCPQNIVVLHCSNPILARVPGANYRPDRGQWAKIAIQEHALVANECRRCKNELSACWSNSSLSLIQQ
jgi:hypothetical protein